MSKVAVCFVCLGNICRSPTAEGVFQKLVATSGRAGDIAIDSAGTGSWHVGQAADARSRAAAEKRGYHLGSRARRVALEDFARFDYILAMDADNLRALLELQRAAKDQLTRPPHVGLLRDFDPSAAKGSVVPDPYYGGDRGFEEVLDICERACGGLLAHIERTHFGG